MTSTSRGVGGDSRSLPPDHPFFKMECQMRKIQAHERGVQQLPTGMHIIFVNGMFNMFLDAAESAIDISKRIGNKKVDYVFNDVHNVDATAKELADKILQKENEFNQTTKKTKDLSIVIIAHSHGAVVLEKTLKDQRLMNRLKKCIRIITIGGAALIPSFPLVYKSVENLINDYDFIPLITHKTFKDNILPDNHTTMNSIIECAFIVRNQFQETLSMSAHKNPTLGDRILSAMQCSWEATSEATPIQESIKALCLDIKKSSTKHITSANPTNEALKNFFCEIIVVGYVHGTYNVKILKTEHKAEQTVFASFFESHSVTSYLPELSQLVLNYIKDYENVE